MPRPLFALALLPLLAACGDKDDDSGGSDGSVGSDLNCTTEARVSVTATVETDGGAAVPDATVTWSVDGGAAQGCEAWPESPDYACGFEVAGAITVVASADGFETASEVVEVPADACHVVSQTVTLVLSPLVGSER